MKHFLLPVLLATLAISFFARAGSIELPKVVNDHEYGGQFWCQNSDVQGGSCQIVAMSDNNRYLLVKTMGGVACGDPEYGVINMATGQAESMNYNDNQACSGEAVAEFTRDPGDNTLTVIMYDPTIKKNVGINKLDF